VPVAAVNSPATRSARRACEPLPDTAPISEKRASTPATVNVGSEAGGGRDRNDAQPTQIWRWRSSPDCQETTIATVSGSAAARRNKPAMWAILLSRDDVPPTSIEVVATSRRSTKSAWHGSPTTLPGGHASVPT